jgi:putative acetyltransferase
MEIRAAQPADAEGVRAVHRAAFETETEANLVEVLHQQASPLVSLVAEDAGSIIGHVLFSPAVLQDHPGVKIMGLAPMAVRPDRQGRGIGSSLVRAGLEACTQAGFAGAIVLGHAHYYPRFGFQPASRFGIKCEYDVPDDVFMALELVPGALAGKTGTIHYHPAFANL